MERKNLCGQPNLICQKSTADSKFWGQGFVDDAVGLYSAKAQDGWQLDINGQHCRKEIGPLSLSNINNWLEK